MATPTTPGRGYKQPDPANLLSQDVLRITDALLAIDIDVVALFAALATQDAAAAKLTGNQTLAGIKTFSSSPVVPDLPAGENSMKAVNAKFVQAAVAALVNSSPAALDTLNELATALGNDPNFATTITNALAAKADAAATTTALAGKAASSHTHTAADITDLASVIAAGNVKLSGDAIQRVFSEAAGVVSLTSAIPMDNTIPQSTEGTQILSATITPTSSTSVLLIEAMVFASETSNVGDAIIAALFQGSQADAVSVGVIGSMNGGANYLTSGMAMIKYRVIAGSTAPIVFTVRAGNNAGAAALNATHTGATLGGKIVSHLTVTEIKA